MRYYKCSSLAVVAVLAFAACSRDRTTGSTDAPPDASSGAVSVAVAPVPSTTRAFTRVQDAASVLEATAETLAVDRCSCVGVPPPKEIVSGTTDGHRDGFGIGQTFVTDDMSLYYNYDYNDGPRDEPDGRLCLTRLVKRTIASGATRVLVDQANWCGGGGIEVSGGMLYWHESAPSSYSALMEGRDQEYELRGVPVQGGPSTIPRFKGEHGASATHLYWMEGTTIFRQALAGGAPTPAHYNVGYGHFIESQAGLYWLENVMTSEPEDSGRVEAGPPHVVGVRLMRLDEKDDPSLPVEWTFFSGPGFHLFSASIHGDYIYMWNGKCLTAGKLDGSAEECVESNEPGVIVGDDGHAYQKTRSGAASSSFNRIVRSTLHGSRSGPLETLLSCDKQIGALVVAPDALFFACGGALWSMSLPPRSTPSPSSSPGPVPPRSERGGVTVPIPRSSR